MTAFHFYEVCFKHIRRVSQHLHNLLEWAFMLTRAAPYRAARAHVSFRNPAHTLIFFLQLKSNQCSGKPTVATDQMSPLSYRLIIPTSSETFKYFPNVPFAALHSLAISTIPDNVTASCHSRRQTIHTVI